MDLADADGSLEDRAPNRLESAMCSDVQQDLGTLLEETGSILAGPLNEELADEKELGWKYLRDPARTLRGSCDSVV